MSSRIPAALALAAALAGCATTGTTYRYDGEGDYYHGAPGADVVVDRGYPGYGAGGLGWGGGYYGAGWGAYGLGWPWYGHYGYAPWHGHWHEPHPPSDDDGHAREHRLQPRVAPRSFSRYAQDPPLQPRSPAAMPAPKRLPSFPEQRAPQLTPRAPGMRPAPAIQQRTPPAPVPSRAPAAPRASTRSN